MNFSSTENLPRRMVRAFLWWCLRVSSRWLLMLGRLLYRMEIHGQEHLTSEGPLIVMARPNGRVMIFMVAFCCLTLQGFHGLAGGHAIVNKRFFTWLGRELGLLPGFKGAHLSGIPLLELYLILQQGKVLLMAVAKELPWDGRLQPLVPGAAWLALRTRAPVVVIAVQGDYDIWPRWASRPHLTGKLVLKVGKPFYLCEAPCQRVTKTMIQDANERLLAEIETLSDGYMLNSKTGPGAIR